MDMYAAPAPIVLNIAHRGARSQAPENTIAAFRAGFEAAADWFELDVAESSDGELVVIHDDTLVRTTNAKAAFPDRAPWSVYDFTLSELRSLDAGSWFAETDPFKTIASGDVPRDRLPLFKGERIPTLREALEYCAENGWRINVEIKDATGRACNARIVEKTVGLIKELRLETRTLISSFNHQYLRRARAAEPRIARGALVEKIPTDAAALLQELGARSLNPGLKWLTDSGVKAVRDAGFDVFVWTVNEEADMQRVIAAGATGMFTDFPGRLRSLLKR